MNECECKIYETLVFHIRLYFSDALQQEQPMTACMPSKWKAEVCHLVSQIRAWDYTVHPLKNSPTSGELMGVGFSIFWYLHVLIFNKCRHPPWSVIWSHCGKAWSIPGTAEADNGARGPVCQVFQTRKEGGSRKTLVILQASKLTLTEVLHCILFSPLMG